MNEGLLDLTVRQLFEQNGTSTMIAREDADGDPLGAVVVVIGAEETQDVVEVLNQQLQIWKTNRKPTRYIDDKNRIVSVRAIRGFRSPYYAFAQGESESVDLLRGKDLPAGCDTFAEAQAMLDAYAKKKNWATVPQPQDVVDAISLVVSKPPDVDLVASWSDIDLVRSAQWAMLTHVRASDNPGVKVPPVPDCLFRSINKFRVEAA